jgi:hypothetical protein
VKENGSSVLCNTAVSQASTRLHSKRKVCKNYHVVGEFETTILAGLCTVSGYGGRLFKRSLNLNVTYKIRGKAMANYS